MSLETRLIAEDAIKRIIYRYCTGIDSGQLDKTAQLFTHGTWFLNPDQPIAGFKAVSEFLNNNVMLYDGVPKTRHCVSNTVVDLDEDLRSARAQSNVIVYQTVQPRMPEIIFQGGYKDTFHQIEGVWFFNERHICTDGIGDMSRHLKTAKQTGSARL
jgi:hypothetical protein